MKMLYKHYKEMREAMLAVDMPTLKRYLKDGGTEKEWRWNWFCKAVNPKWVETELRPYLSNDSIDTALRVFTNSKERVRTYAGRTPRPLSRNQRQMIESKTFTKQSEAVVPVSEERLEELKQKFLILEKEYKAQVELDKYLSDELAKMQRNSYHLLTAKNINGNGILRLLVGIDNGKLVADCMDLSKVVLTHKEIDKDTYELLAELLRDHTV